MTETALQQPGRELDALVHQRVYGVPTEMRLCMRDPESGVWEEVQAHYERQGEELPKVGWYHAVHPCWLEVTPLPDDWTNEDRQQYPDAGSRWEVVPHYSTRIEDAWLLVEKVGLLREAHLQQGQFGGNEWIVYKDMWGVAWDWHVVADTPTHAICLGVLQLVERQAHNV